MRTVLGTALLFLIVFFIVLLVGTNFSQTPVHQMAALEQAARWTLLMFGALIATASSVGLLMVAAAHGSFERQAALVLPLLGGLLLMTSNWGLAIAMGGIVTAWLLRERSATPR